MQDQTINCKDCPNTFVWTAGDQEFYQSKGFNAPTRCKDCRVKARAAFNDRQGGGGGGYNKRSGGGDRGDRRGGRNY